MGAEVLLSKLERVRRTGEGRWSARCPAHADRSPSLAIRELPQGLVVLKCFAGCTFAEIIGAASVDAAEMFPPKPIEHAPRDRRPFIPQDVFHIARQEIGVAAIIAADMHKQRLVSDADYQRLLTVVERLNGIAEAAYARS